MVVLQGLDDPLLALTTLVEDDGMTRYGVCGPCMKTVKARISNTRLEWWEGLNEDFSIEKD